MNRIGSCSGAILLALIIPSVAGDQITVYTAPKDRPAMAAGAPNIPVNSSPIHWTTPAGWDEKPADGIRLGSFAIKSPAGGRAEVAITSFPGSVGTELDNVNRWRGELGMQPTGPDGVTSEPVTVDGIAGKLYNLGNDSARTMVAVIMREGSSWYLKLRGDAPAVAAAAPAFMEFLKSVRFGGPATSPVPGEAPATAPMAVDMKSPALPPGHSDTAETDDSANTPQWKIPADWTPAPSRPMLFKVFTLAGEADAKAEVTISFFQGEVGGMLLNVNRWRGQLGQPPIDQAQLDSVLDLISTAEGKATMVDFTGTDIKTGAPARLVAAIVPHAGYTWFYKLMGNGKLVGSQKDSFVQFVKTVHYR